MEEDKNLEEAIKVCKKIATTKFNNDYSIDSEDKQAIETVLREIENRIPKETIRQKIDERQFELQQEYKDFKEDTRLNVLQEIYYLNESEK